MPTDEDDAVPRMAGRMIGIMVGIVVAIFGAAQLVGGTPEGVLLGLTFLTVGGILTVALLRSGGSA